jgi:hypothetical protein
MKLNTSRRRSFSSLVAAAAVLAALAVGAPANAAEPVPASAQASATGSEVSTSAQFGAAPAIVTPKAAAGAKNYVCVLADGRTVAVQSGQKTVSVCKGANAIQVYYDTGQFIRTVTLSPSGKPATAHFTPGSECLLAIVTGGAGIVLTGTGGVAGVLSASITAGVVTHSCVSA